jgi:hypothetical protein
LRAVTIRIADGTNRAIELPDGQEWTCGSDGGKAQFQLGAAAGGVAGVHVRLTQKGRRQVFLTALVGESVLDDSRTWLDGQPLRPNVQYVIGSGQRIDMGRLTLDEAGAGASAAPATSAPPAAAAFRVEFVEGEGRDPLVEMMMAGFAGGSKDSQDKLREALK